MRGEIEMTKRQIEKENQTAIDGVELLQVIDCEDVSDDIESIESSYLSMFINQNLSIEGSS